MPDQNETPSKQKSVAYICMEYALEENLPIYAGGLGVLAADIVKDASRQNFNFSAFGLFYFRGFHAYHHGQEIDLNPQSVGFAKSLDQNNKPLLMSIPVENREIWVQTWIKKYGSAQVFLFDTNLELNSQSDRNITQYLYGPDNETMLIQQLVLAQSTQKLIRHLNFMPDVYHLNEGHTAMTILVLALSCHRSNPNLTLEQCLDLTKRQIIATKHTILTGGGLHIPKDQLTKIVGPLLAKESFTVDELFSLCAHETHPDSFSTTHFLMRFCARSSAVSLAHATAEKKVHPHSQLIPVTNGINLETWQSPPLRNLAHSTSGEIWQIHQLNKNDMLNFLGKQNSHQLDPNVLTVVWARRFVSYKRPELLFSNIEALSQITKLLPAVQFIVAGQINPVDTDAVELAAEIKNQINKSLFSGRIVFLTTYSLALAKKLVAGADVWLNTPVPGFEASGTSGMKAGANGALQFSTNDGWISEVDWENVGWLLPEENISQQLYQTLEREIIPLYYHTNGSKFSQQWVQRMQKTIDIITQKFTTVRVLQDYYDKLYFPQNKPGKI